MQRSLEVDFGHFTKIEPAMRAIEDLTLYAVVARKPGLPEYLAFAPGGRPAVFWTRRMAELYLSRLRLPGRVKTFTPFRK
jgi:hypothetical protein